MTPTTLTAAAAAEHVRDLQTAARESRLAALARCCHPSQLRRTASRAATAIRTVLAGPSAGPATAGCCA